MGSRRAVADAISSRRWSVFAGVYLFLCGTAVAVLLSDLLGLLADVIGLSVEHWMVVLAGPAAPIGAGVWWIAVERRGAYSYLAATLFGLTATLLTGLLWTGRFIQVWSLELAAVRMTGLLILVVLGFTAVSGVLAAVPFMYLRRRVGLSLSRENDDRRIEPER
ncbi:MAG: hypothetical protein A07HN63_00446 [uncultured archaeon A07HN63]|nr:MAG: hypothetical protein A07HN63_00446 [uncultured archaeon A07HN63]